MNRNYLLFLLLFLSCKKSENQVQNQVSNFPGSFSFQFGNNTIDVYGNSTSGNTNFCRLIQIGSNTYFNIGGNQIANGEVYPKITFESNVKMPSNKIILGSYNSSIKGNYISFKSQNHYQCSCYDLYNANDTTTSKIIFNVLSYDSITKYVKCTFSGTLQKEGNTSTVSIANGTIYGILP